MQHQGCLCKGGSLPFFSPFLLPVGWNADMMAGPGAAISAHELLLGMKAMLHIVTSQNQHESLTLLSFIQILEQTWQTPVLCQTFIKEKTKLLGFLLLTVTHNPNQSQLGFLQFSNQTMEMDPPKNNFIGLLE